jgi:hypothetical protein
MITHRQLTNDDIEQMIVMINARPDVFMGYSDDQFKNNIITVLPKIIDNPLHFNLGLFSDGHLLGFGLMKEMTTQPAWVWGYWLMHHDSYKKIMGAEMSKILSGLDNDLFDEMEQSRKLFKFYASHPNTSPESTDLKSISSADRLINFATKYQAGRGVTFRAASYKFYNECIVPANTLPKYAYQQAIMADRTWPINTLIRVAIKSVQ